MISKKHEKKDETLQGTEEPQVSCNDIKKGIEEENTTVSAAASEDLERQVADYKEKYLRILAEFENARKRQERERVEFIKYANEGLLIDFLNIVDDLDRAVIAAKEKHQDYDAFLKGVEMVMRRVSELLKKHGVEAVEPMGKPFDPYAHEILMQEPSADHENGTVIESFQKGYKIGDKVIRTAKVKVAINNITKDKDTETSGH